MVSKAEQRFAEALTLHQRGELAEAERLYRQVIARQPDHLDALNLLGVLALQSGRNQEAIDLIARALAKNDRVADFHNNIAEAYRRCGRFDDAAAHFTKATELEPTFVAAHQNLAATLRAQEKWDLILRHCQLAVKDWGAEDPAIRSMRARLMAYSKGFPGSKVLREKFQHVSMLADVEGIAREHLEQTFAATSTLAAA